jgi:hypothetical protein
MVRYKSNATYIIVTKIIIDRWSVYGCRSSVRNRPHSDPIVNMGIIVPVISIRTYMHALHHLPDLAHLLSHLLLKLLKVGFPKSFLVTNSDVKEILTVGKGIVIEVIIVV